MISFALTEEQELIRDTARKLAAEEIRPRLRQMEKARADPDELAAKLHAVGLTLVELPEALGGQGALTAALVHEELAAGDPGAAVALWAPHLVPAALAELASPAQAARLLGPFAERQLRGAVAWNGEVRARRDGDAWILDGKKAFVINAGIADVTLVLSRDGGFVVRRDNPGLRAGARSEWLGLETVHAGEIVLEGCRVAEDDRLDALTVASLRRFFARAALVTAARQVGLARAAYETALAYTQERRAFGKPVAHFQSVAFSLAEMHMDVESARWMVWRAAVELDAGAASALASVGKAAVHANEAAWRVADDAVQLHGGAGYIQDFPVEKWLRDTKTLALVGGSDQLAQLDVAGVGDGLPDDVLQPVVT